MADNKKYLDLNGLSYAIRKINNKKANIESPVLTGTPKAPTSEVINSTNQIATTDFVHQIFDLVGEPVPKRYIPDESNITIGRLESGGYEQKEVTQYAISDFIRCEGTEKPVITININNAVWDEWFTWDFFDYSKTYIPDYFGSKNFNGDKVSFRITDIPENASYFRICFPYDADSDDPTRSISIDIITQNSLSTITSQVKELYDNLDKTISLDPVTNIYTVADDYQMGRLEWGTVGGHTDQGTTGFIPINPNLNPQIYLLPEQESSFWYTYTFFDKDMASINDSFVSTTLSGVSPYKISSIPEDAKYLRVCFPIDSNADDPTLGFKIKIIADSIFKQEFDQLKEKYEDLQNKISIEPKVITYDPEVDGYENGRLEWSNINTSANDFVTSPYLNCKSTTSAEIYAIVEELGYAWYAYNFYDENKNYITDSYISTQIPYVGELSLIGNQQFQITQIPENACYFRISFPIDTETKSTKGFKIKIITKGLLASKLENVGNASSFDYKKYEGVLHYGGMRLPVLKLTGDISTMTKDNKVDLEYKYIQYNSRDSFEQLSGTLSCKWQGSSSIYFPKKNYTITFDNAFNPRLYQTDGPTLFSTGWGNQKKYCLKANYVDVSQSRNIICSKMWGQMVKTRPNANDRLKALPNGGAIDGFPILLVINDQYQGLYTFNIPKDAWMFGMTGGTEGFVCADASGDVPEYRQACCFKNTAIGTDADGQSDFKIEYCDDSFKDTILSNLNNLISTAMSATNISQLSSILDIDSAIDYMLFIAAIGGLDNVVKNYLLSTYDGTKWFFSVYDMDGTLGNHWSGEYMLPTNSYPTFANLISENKIFELIWNTAKPQLINRWQQLKENILTEDNLFELAYNFQAAIPKAAMDQENLLWPKTPGTLNNNIDQMCRWFRLRLKVLDKELNLPTTTSLLEEDLNSLVSEVYDNG